MRQRRRETNGRGKRENLSQSHWKMSICDKKLKTKKKQRKTNSQREKIVKLKRIA